MTHECADCKYAKQLAEEQHIRFFDARPINATTFLSRPYEDEMSALQISLLRRCALRQQADIRFPSPK